MNIHKLNQYKSLHFNHSITQLLTHSMNLEHGTDEELGVGVLGVL